MKVKTGITEGSRPAWPRVGDVVKVETLNLPEIGTVTGVDWPRRQAEVEITFRVPKTGKLATTRRSYPISRLSPASEGPS